MTTDVTPRAVPAFPKKPAIHVPKDADRLLRMTLQAIKERIEYLDGIVLTDPRKTRVLSGGGNTIVGGGDGGSTGGGSGGTGIKEVYAQSTFPAVTDNAILFRTGQYADPDIMELWVFMA